MLSVAAPTQKIAQAVPRVGVNRPSLKVGSQGEPVSELQAALKLLGFYIGTVDGVYNESTAIAVSQFQQAAGLNPDGVVDTTTWQRLFPNEPIASSSVSSPNSASRFPIPSQTSNRNAVVVPTGNQRITTTTTTTTNRSVNLKPEPKPTTTTTTNTTRVANSQPEPKPVTRVATNSSERSSSRQTSPTRSRSSTSSRQTTRTQQTARASSRQTTRSGSSTRAQETAYFQYTSGGEPILRAGMRGSEVVRLQQRLRRLGYLDEGEIDGDFGAATESAVISLQKRYGLEADGVVGGATWDILSRRRGR